MMLSLDTAYRSFGGEVEASSTPTICRLSDSRRHQLSAIAPRHWALAAFVLTARLYNLKRRVSGGSLGEAGMRDPKTVAAIVNVLRQAYGDDIARVMLNDGLSL